MNKKMEFIRKQEDENYEAPEQIPVNPQVALQLKMLEYDIKSATLISEHALMVLNNIKENTKENHEIIELKLAQNKYDQAKVQEEKLRFTYETHINHIKDEWKRQKELEKEKQKLEEENKSLCIWSWTTEEDTL